MTNPEDIDDCMQTGYLKVWEQLQINPNLFEGKPRQYIVQAVILRSKAQRYAHIRHYRKIIYDADAYSHPNTSDLTPSQVETWVDLAQVIQRVADYTVTLENPAYLLALYSLITDVKTQDVARTNGYGVSTLTTAKRKVRATVAKALPDYGSSEDTIEPLPLPRIRSFQLAQLQKQLISPQIFEDTPLRPRRDQPSEHVYGQSPLPPQPQSIQEPCIETPEPIYQTRWKGKVRLAELILDTQVRKVAFAKMRSLGYTDEDAEDCFQLGSINLWKSLQEQPDLLADKGPGWVGVWIAFSGSRRSLWKHKVRCTSLDDPQHDWQSSDERNELYQRGRPERWASWATRVDQRIDFTMLMNALAQQYADDPVSLFALYSLTTSVKMKDVLAAANADKTQLVQARHRVKADIRQYLEHDQREQIDTEFYDPNSKLVGNHDDVRRVAKRILEDYQLLCALYSVTTSVKRGDVIGMLDIGMTTFRKKISLVKQMLAEEFRRAIHEGICS